MIQITNFTVKKAWEPEGGFKPDAPERELSANIGTKEAPNYIVIGKGWLKKDKNDNTYTSIALETDRSYETKAKQDGTPSKTVHVDGWVLVKTKDLKEIEAIIHKLKEKVKDLESLIPKDEFTKAIDQAYDKPLDEVVF